MSLPDASRSLPCAPSPYRSEDLLWRVPRRRRAPPKRSSSSRSPLIRIMVRSGRPSPLKERG